MWIINERIFKNIRTSFSVKFNRSNFIWKKKFEEPILQIDIGNYVIRSDEYQLGILQSNRFFSIKISKLKEATNIEIKLDNKLKRKGHNFTRGKIGERKNDILFLQSIVIY